MTKTELIKAMDKLDDDAIVIISDSEGWSNIERVEMDGVTIAIVMEQYPVFSNHN